MSRHFVPSQGLSCEVTDLVRADGFYTIFKHDHCGDLFDPLFVCATNNGHFCNCRMPVNGVLNFTGCYQDATRIDNVFDPVHDFDIAAFIHDHEVARAEPTIHEGLSSLLWFIPVSREELWRSVLDFARTTDVDFFTCGRIDDAELYRHHRTASRGRTFVMLFGAQNCTQRCHFTLTKAVIEANLGVFLP